MRRFLDYWWRTDNDCRLHAFLVAVILLPPIVVIAATWAWDTWGTAS